MATAIKTPRLLAAAKEFNIGKDTLLEYLTGKGFEINASNPNTKLTEPMYDALQAEFAQDKLAKRKSDEIALPKGSMLDNLKKTKEDLDLNVRDKKEDTVAAPVQEKKKEEKKEEKAPVAEVPKAPEPAPVKVPEMKVAEPVKAPEQLKPEPEIKQTTKAPEQEDSLSEISAPATQEGNNIKAPKLEGPNILGKINLDDMNLASRPKKGAAVKKSAEKKETDKPKKQATAKASKTEAKPAPKKTQVEIPTAPQKEPEVPVEDSKPEHIEMKAPRLEGPKIIGKIDLPVDNGGASNNRQDRGEKRKRKRIPLEKRPETFKPDQPGQPREVRPAAGRDNRGPGQGSGTGRPFGGGGTGRPQAGGGGTGRPTGNGQGRPQGGGQGRSQGGGAGRFQRPVASPQQTEIDTKAIQEKIRETQAKLTGSTRGKSLKSKYRRNKREEMAEKRAAEEVDQGNIIQVTEFISVSELANLLNVSFADVISKCMSLGIMVSINQRLDAEVIELVAGEFNYVVEFINLEQTTEEDEEDDDAPEDLIPRAPIVTIMGHVDHGKTSLLDYIRSANVVAGESGGITQHIGAYQVTTAHDKKITFLDTPGHEAFTAMRARGAKVADLAVIVIAADDAIMPQTKEAISHAQAANLPMIFAINKIDKEGANSEKIKEQLANMNLLVEDWGGKYQSQEISAKKGLNIDLLLEKIVLESELLELKANPDRYATGSVIEASLDKGRGYQATILVQSGTLEQGDMIVCGQYYGKIKAMFNERGQRATVAGPSMPVQVLGLNGAPQAGEKFRMFEDEDEAKEVATHRAQIMREQGIRARKHITLDEIGRRLALGSFKELGIIIKGDFDGSVEALSDSLQKLSTEEVAVNVVHKGVGQITESDVLLATASDAIILGFQVRPSLQAARLAEQENIEIRTYSIIYDAIEEIKSAMEGLLEPKVEKKTVSNIEVREIFKIGGIGTIAGCYVLDGKMARSTKLNLVRDGIVIYNGELSSLKRFKDDVKEVNAGYECGLMIKNYNDMRVGDIIEGYEEVEVKRTL
ncbi:MAG: translation initiation factor IF-2 [Taibaiella sp.]|nr:translation initiation factor IF-2 [Taibaiella sp.]